jgi:hypothetical protein
MKDVKIPEKMKKIGKIVKKNAWKNKKTLPWKNKIKQKQ